MRLQFMLACFVLLPDSCESNPGVRSYYPLVGREQAMCDAPLTGAWTPDSAASTDERWVVMDSDPEDSSCVLDLYVTDSTLARIVTDSVERAMFDDGGWRPDSLSDHGLSHEQFSLDSARLEAEFEADTISYWQVRLARAPAGLFVDLSRDPPYASLMGGSEIRTHWLWKATAGDTSMTLARFSTSWLRRMSDSGLVTVSHSNIDGEFVVTATGEELLALMSRFADDTGAFPGKGSIRLHR